MEEIGSELARKEDRWEGNDNEVRQEAQQQLHIDETADMMESGYKPQEEKKDYLVTAQKESIGQGKSGQGKLELEEYPTQPMAVEALLVGDNLRQGSLPDISQTPTHKVPVWKDVLRTEISTLPHKQPATTVAPMSSAPATGILNSESRASLLERPTLPLATVSPGGQREFRLSRGWAAFLAILLLIVVLNATIGGFNQFFGPQGWSTAFNSPGNSNDSNLLSKINQTPVPGKKAAPTVLTPLQTVNLLLSNMTLAEKLGQMMMIQFTGPDYSLDLSTMLTQYKVGSVLVFTANGNIVSRDQLKSLIAQMQHNAFLPLAVSIDQEGGQVDRLVNLDGPQPSEASIGASGDPNQAYQQGLKDAQDLTSYGFNLNLAPVVDVTNVYNSQLYERTYGNNPTIVTQMAQAYLRGLQQSGHVLGTLKHFPGLGDVSVDPHYRAPDLTRSLADLNAIDWAPYRQLIAQGNVHAIMVTHEYVQAVDTNEPSSLSAQVIGVLRNQFHFQGVIMTDSLTMDSIHNYYTYGQAAAMAVEAGDDMLMGAESPADVAQMLDGIKQAITNGNIKSSQIDDSVRRILLLKYEMGLIHVSQ